MFVISPKLFWFTAFKHTALLGMFVRSVATVVVSIADIRQKHTARRVRTLEFCRITGALAVKIIFSFIGAIATIVITITFKLHINATTWNERSSIRPRITT